MVRAPCFDERGLKRGAWSEEEDEKLRSYIQKNGHPNWRQLPRLAGLSRCGKSCRLRWMNYLRPNLKRGNFTKQEEDVIIDLHNKFGGRWSMMAKQLRGRSDNEIKNHWHAHLKNRVRKDQTVLKDVQPADHQSLELVAENPKECGLGKLNLEAQLEVQALLAVLSSGFPSSHSSSESTPRSSSASDSAAPTPRDVTQEFSELAGDLWTDPFLSYNENVMTLSDKIFSPLGLADDDVDHLLWFL